MDPRVMLLAGGLLAVLLAGCGGADDAADADAAAEDGDDAASEDDGGDAAADDGGGDAGADGGDEEQRGSDAGGDEVTVATAEVGDHGEILVDDEGMTLYLFDPDEQGPSTCVDDCAANWPPLVVEEEPAAGDGVDPDLLGTAERDDGSQQVTYDGWPLYHWAGDQEPGEATGQGVEDVWWVVQPDAAAIRETSEDAGAGPSY
ncbi:MAG: hypothetical protein ACOC9I_02650 [Actinomycetota bacterium]